MIEPGPKLDALIAEKVFGYKTYDTVNPFDPRDKNIYNMSVIDNKNHCRQTLNYSTSIADAWQVVEKLKQDNFFFICGSQIIGMVGVSDGIWASFGKIHEIAQYTVGGNFPHAICLAALKAVGVEV